MVLVGLYTQSLKKMAATYFFGMLAIGGVLLPDWKFFDRPVSQWRTLVSDDRDGSSQSVPAQRFKLYPMRAIIYVPVYGVAFRKWWNFITSEN